MHIEASFVHPFVAACDLAGNVTIARAVPVSPQAVSKYRRLAAADPGFRIPAEWVIPTERATDGRVTRSALRPDLYPAAELVP